MVLYNLDNLIQLVLFPDFRIMVHNRDTLVGELLFLANRALAFLGESFGKPSGQLYQCLLSALFPLFLIGLVELEIA